MSRFHRQSAYLRALYKKRPDLHSLVQQGEEAVMRRLVEMEAAAKSKTPFGDS